MDSLDRRLILGAFVLVALAFGYVSCRQRRADARAAAGAQTPADQHRDAATSHAAQGAIHDQQFEAKKPEAEQNAAEVARLRAEVARLRKAGSPVAPAPSPAAPNPEPVVPPVDLAALVAKQDELIQAQDRQISGLQGQVHTLTLARDSWRAAAGDSAAEAVQLRAVIAAREGLARAAYWRGFRHGFLAGGVSGVATDEAIRWRLR